MRGRIPMKRLFALAAALLTSLVCWFPPTAAADPVGPTAALKAICVQQGGIWYPSEVELVGKVVCYTDGFIVPSTKQLTYLNSLCKAAGYGGVRWFGKGIPVPGIYVATWSCY
jgi:hypothetical protein